MANVNFDILPGYMDNDSFTLITPIRNQTAPLEVHNPTIFPHSPQAFQ